MPSQRKRIGFLPSVEVHDIINKLCKANEYSQSKITGLLVEEALRSRGVLGNNLLSNNIGDENFINDSFEQEQFSKNNKLQSNFDDYTDKNESLPVDIKMMYEYIEYKYFKKIMKNNNIVD